jgi:hypothetical protein
MYKESFDLCVKVFADPPLYVFMDAKSRREVQPLGINGATSIANNPYQYFNVKKLAGRGGLNFLYIYVSTYETATQLLGDPDDVCVFMGRESTKKLLGPIFEMYCALRATL